MSGPARRCCKDPLEAELALRRRCLGEADEDGLCRSNHRVQHLDRNGDLARGEGTLRARSLGPNKCLDLDMAMPVMRSAG